VTAWTQPDGTTNGKPEAGPAAVQADEGAGEPPRLARLRLDLGYDGARFHGWAAQPGTRTVQGVLSGALAVALRLPEPPVLTVAGRTDAGVHARGQVAHLDAPEPAWAAAEPVALSRLNRVLPADIRVAAIQLASPGFDARFSALWRQYSYRICDTAARADPLRRHDTLWHRRHVDHALMNEAAAACLGEHDFAAFCRRRPTGTTVRELLRLRWHRDEAGVVVGTVAADAFCHNMVRSLVGALLAVGDGRKPATWPAAVLAAAVRDPGVTVAPPHPLCLEHVEYPPAAELEARARLTRRVRGANTGQGGG
jgi:tRNA pseudouridine38-40 synthase